MPRLPGRDFNLLLSVARIIPEERSGSSTVGWVGGMDLIAGNIAEVAAALSLVEKKQTAVLVYYLKGIMSTIRVRNGHLGAEVGRY